MKKEDYIEQLDVKRLELECTTKGVVEVADKYIHDCAEATAKTPLSIERLTELVISLNAIFNIYSEKEKELKDALKALDDYLAGNGEDNDDNHE